jgi:hypothetical protein
MFTAGGLLSPAPCLADGDPNCGVAGPLRPLLRPQPRPHVPWPDWAQAGGALAASKETVSLDFPLKSFEATYNLSLVMSHDQTELKRGGGGELASLKGNHKWVFLSYFFYLLKINSIFRGLILLAVLVNKTVVKT